MIHVMHNLFGIRIGESLRIKAYPHWYCASAKRLFAMVHKRSKSIAAPKLGGSSNMVAVKSKEDIFGFFVYGGISS